MHALLNIRSGRFYPEWNLPDAFGAVKGVLPVLLVLLKLGFDPSPAGSFYRC